MDIEKMAEDISNDVFTYWFEGDCPNKPELSEYMRDEVIKALKQLREQTIMDCAKTISDCMKVDFLNKETVTFCRMELNKKLKDKEV